MKTGNSFIETGVLIGFCVLLDPHHRNCKEYLEIEEFDFYTSSEVHNEYSNTKGGVTTRLSNAVLDHLRDLKSDSSEDYLDPMDVNRVKKNVLDPRNDAFQFLYAYYDKEVNNGVSKSELMENLRKIARDIDGMVIAREQELNSQVSIWEQASEHPDVRSALSMMHEPDQTFAVQAHDLAENKSEGTELATTNPADFIVDDRKSTIIENTALVDVIDLSV